MSTFICDRHIKRWLPQLLFFKYFEIGSNDMNIVMSCWDLIGCCPAWNLIGCCPAYSYLWLVVYSFTDITKIVKEREKFLPRKWRDLRMKGTHWHTEALLMHFENRRWLSQSKESKLILLFLCIGNHVLFNFLIYTFLLKLFLCLCISINSV